MTNFRPLFGFLQKVQVVEVITEVNFKCATMRLMKKNPDSQPPRLMVDFSPTTILKVLLAVALFLVVIELTTTIIPIMMMIFSAIFLAIALNPAVSRIVRYLPSRNRFLATGLAYTIVVGLIAGFLALTLPDIIDQIKAFSEEISKSYHNFKSGDSALAEFIKNNQYEDEIRNGIESAVGQLLGTDGGIGGLLGKIVSSFVNIAITLFLSFMLLVDGPRLVRRLSSFTDPKKLAHRKQVVAKMCDVITGYVNGQFIIATISTLSALVFMLLLSEAFGLHVPNALAMAGIVGLLGLIPLVGATLGAVIVVAAALLSDPDPGSLNIKLAVILAIYFFIYQQIENATIQPYIQGRKLSLSAFLVLIATLIGAKVAGILGALLAIPLAGCLKILIIDYLSHPDHYSSFLKLGRFNGR